MKVKWDTYFHDICETVAQKSPCLSRQIGAILVKDRVVVATGYNGPPRGCVHCAERSSTEGVCPRKVMGYKSGQGLEYCPAVHAEMNAVVAAARNGVSVKGATLYMNCVVPCKQCLGILINAGVAEIVVDDDTPYDSLSVSFYGSDSMPVIRTFKED